MFYKPVKINLSSVHNLLLYFFFLSSLTQLDCLQVSEARLQLLLLLAAGQQKHPEHLILVVQICRKLQCKIKNLFGQEQEKIYMRQQKPAEAAAAAWRKLAVVFGLKPKITEL